MAQKTKIVRKINGTTKTELVELLMQRLQPQIKAHLQRWLDLQLLEITVHEPKSNAFAIRYSDYTRLSEDEERELQEKIYMENYDWIESALARRKAEWMIVINGHVVRSSRTLDNIPTQPQLDQLGKKKGFVPFLFVRNALIEEASVMDQNATSWSRVSISDFYPTIALIIGKPRWSDSQLLKDGQFLTADFDTGCPAIIFDSKALGSPFLLPIAANIQGQHLSRPYWCSIQKFKLGVRLSPETMRAKTITVRIVKNWERSPFKTINPNCKALIGRNLLLELMLKILLDGQNKITEILG